jgi:hypothetical protein
MPWAVGVEAQAAIEAPPDTKEQKQSAAGFGRDAADVEPS